MRQGLSVGVSMAIGMAIFVLAIASVFLLLQGTLIPNGGFSEQIASSTDYALDRFQQETEWTVYRQPVFIHADTAISNEPLELTVPFDPAADADSVAYIRDGTEIVSQHDAVENTSVVVTDLRNGTTRLDVVYTSGYELSDRSYTSALQQAGNSTWNTDLNVTVTGTGIEQITYKELDVLTSAADIGVSSVPQFDHELLRTNITYDETDSTSVKVFDGSGQIPIRDEFSGEQVWTFNLTDNFTTMYSEALGGTQDLTGSGTLYTDTTDFVDFYNLTGMAVIGDDMFVNVSRATASSPIDVRINFTATRGEKAVLLYLHDGNYTNAEPYKETFYDPYTASVSVPEAVTGVSRDRATALESRSYDQVRDTLGLAGTNYNITLGTAFTKGQAITVDATVYATQFPVPMMDRFTNATAQTLQMRVWNQ
jgi:hypothetical protein